MSVARRPSASPDIAAVISAAMVVCVCEPECMRMFLVVEDDARLVGEVAVPAGASAMAIAVASAGFARRLGWFSAAMAASPTRRRSPEVVARAQALVTLLREVGEALTAHEIMARTGYGREVYRYLSRLVDLGALERSGRGRGADPYRYRAVTPPAPRRRRRPVT